MPDDDHDDNKLPPGIVRARPKPNDSDGPSPPSPLPSLPLRGGRGVPAPSPRSASPDDSETIAGTISAIEPQVRREGRVNIYIGGTFAMGLFEDVVVALGLRVGQAISAERLEAIAKAETLRQAKEDAYNLLSYRARSEKEIRDRLQRKKHEDDVIEAVVVSLRENGYLNDAAFAQAWIDARGKSRGRRALAHELRLKGVAVDEALSERDDDSEKAAARAAAIKKVGERPADPSRESQARLAAFLQRRGFGWDSIRPVLAELYGNTPSIDDESE